MLMAIGNSIYTKEATYQLLLIDVITEGFMFQYNY